MTFLYQQLKFLNKEPLQFVRRCVDNHTELSFEYSVLCTKLAHDFTHCNLANLTETLEEALVMAVTLEEIYRTYLKMPLAAERYARDLALYRQLLSKKPVTMPIQDDSTPIPTPVGQSIRELTPTANMSRQFLNRTRRLLIFIVPFINDIGGYSNWVNQMDAIANPIFSYAAWIFFIPRVLTNLFLTAKHVIPGPWMDKAEKSLGFQTRMKAQMAMRQFELANDLVSVTCNLLNCFIFFGTFSPIGLCITTGLLAYESILALVRYHKEIDRLMTLEKSYTQLLEKGNLTPSERKEIEGYLTHFRERMTYERKRLMVPVLMMSTLLFAFALTLPLMAICPIVPLVGAAIALLATVAFYCVNQWVKSQKPEDNLMKVIQKKSNVATQGFFKPMPSKNLPTVENTKTISHFTKLTGAG